MLKKRPSCISKNAKLNDKIKHLDKAVLPAGKSLKTEYFKDGSIKLITSEGYVLMDKAGLIKESKTQEQIEDGIKKKEEQKQFANAKKIKII